MKQKLIKKNGKCYVQLPDQFNSQDEIELFQLRDNFWLVSAQLGIPAGEKTSEKASEKQGKKLSEQEMKVLKELMQIRFADRTPSNIEKTFSSEDKNIVKQLTKKGFIQVFYGKKYSKTGVYNISDEIYPMIGKPIPSAEPKAETKKSVAEPRQYEEQRRPEAQHSNSVQAPPPAYYELVKAGWLIISNPKDAETFSYHIKNSGLSGNVKGVRGFDGKFYVATSTFLYSTYEKIKAPLEKKKEMHLSELAQLANVEPEGASVILHLLAESGEIIEKKRDVFCLA